MENVKFRCYSNNKMYEVDSLHFWDNSIDLSGAGIISMENAKLMQYTGLHDKNGKEIYEGDIVEFEDTGEEGYEYKEGFGFNNIAQVVYENGIYTLANFGESDNSYYATDCSDEEILEEVLRNGNCEVIGNIYENSELLGGEDE